MPYFKKTKKRRRSQTPEALVNALNSAESADSPPEGRRSQTPQMPISGRGLDSGEGDGAIEHHDIYDVEDSLNYWAFEDDDYNEGLMTYDLEVVRNQYRNDDEFKLGVWMLNKKRGMKVCNEERPPSRSELFEKLKQLDWKLDLGLCADLVYVLSRDELNEFMKPIRGAILHQISLFSLHRVDYILTGFYRCQLCHHIVRIPNISGLMSECSQGCVRRRRKTEPLPFMLQLPKPSVLDGPALLAVISEATVDVVQKFWNDPDLAKAEMENLIKELNELEDEIDGKANGERLGWVYCHFSQDVLAMDSGMMRAFTARYVGSSISTTRPCHHFWLSQKIGPHARFITKEFTQSRAIFWSRVRLPRIAMHLAESAISDLLRPLLSNHNSPKGTAPGCKEKENAMPSEWMQTGSEKRQKLAASLLCVLTRLLIPGKVAQSEVVVSDGVSETIQLCGWEDAFRCEQHFCKI